jgi:hypothetical protein
VWSTEPLVGFGIVCPCLEVEALSSDNGVESDHARGSEAADCVSHVMASNVDFGASREHERVRRARWRDLGQENPVGERSWQRG